MNQTTAMKTLAETQSELELVDSVTHTTSADIPARFITRNLHRVWQIRRMQATLLRPFRKILRPFAHWLRQEHFFIGTGDESGSRAGLNLRTFGWETMVLSAILAPLAFLMLLPLLLIILPAAACLGLVAVVFTGMQTDEEEAVHHSIAWHALH
jgi:hypothetical protein